MPLRRQLCAGAGKLRAWWTTSSGSCVAFSAASLAEVPPPKACRTCSGSSWSESVLRYVPSGLARADAIVSRTQAVAHVRHHEEGVRHLPVPGVHRIGRRPAVRGRMERPVPCSLGRRRDVRADHHARRHVAPPSRSALRLRRSAPCAGRALVPSRCRTASSLNRRAPVERAGFVLREVFDVRLRRDSRRGRQVAGCRAADRPPGARARGVAPGRGERRRRAPSRSMACWTPS